jgi:hypothetical protein
MWFCASPGLACWDLTNWCGGGVGFLLFIFCSLDLLEKKSGRQRVHLVGLSSARPGLFFSLSKNNKKKI